MAASESLARLYSASRLFVNVLQPLFKLAEKRREGPAYVIAITQRRHRALGCWPRMRFPAAMKDRLGALLGTLDPLGLLNDVRNMQHHLAALAAGVTAHPMLHGMPISTDS